MHRWFRRLRNAIHPRAGFAARGNRHRIRGSDVIIGMMLALLAVLGLASVITHLLAA